MITVTVTNSLIGSFTGSYFQNFNLDLTNSATLIPSGFQAFGLPGDHFTFTNGTPITSNAIVQVTAGATSMTVWNAGSAVAKAGSTLFNVGNWDSLNNRSIGTDPTGNAGTVIQLALSNSTGGLLPGVIFSYTERCLTNGSTSNGSYTDDGTERLELPGYSFFYSLVGDTNASNWFYVPVLSLTNWVQGTSSNSGPVLLTFPTALTNRGVMYFRWADDNCVASSPDQMFAIDDISITPSITTNIFQTAYGISAGFFSGENVAFTNTSGVNYYIWASADPSLPVTSWVPQGLMQEQALVDIPGSSRYSANIVPTNSPTYYIYAKTNSGPYTSTEAVMFLTTDDYVAFNVVSSNAPISSLGVFQLSAAPLISIATPIDGQVFNSPATVGITTSTLDAYATITNVAFYSGSNLLANVTTQPFSLGWSNVLGGSYLLSAVAMDDQGLSTTSAVVHISVVTPNQPPTVTLTSPANGTLFVVPTNITLSATAADADGSVSNVSFYNGSSLLATLSTPPYTFTWSNVVAGGYVLSAVAIDNLGLAATSSVANITVTNPYVVQAIKQAKTVFVIAMENHNLSQIVGNAAAPYINSLMTPGNSNSVQTSYATHYYNSGVGVHPSEPNYVWAEAGTDFGVHTDNDPSSGSGNVFTAPHLTAQMNTAGVTWKNYQEDVQYSGSPTSSAAGTSSTINPYYATGDYNYAVKHNPMAFFTDTATQNVYPFTNFFNHLSNNLVGSYNWITPNQYDDMHSGLGSGFTYQGTAYSGDQAAVAQGDNFLSIVVPKIMASDAYKSNGIIILWWDETEGGDGTGFSIPEIIISPLAKGNAYNSTNEYGHSSDLKTMEEIFGLPFLSNSIPSGETRAGGVGYNNVATVNDLSDMFKTTSIVPPSNLAAGLVNGPGVQVSFTVPTNQTYRILYSDDMSKPVNTWSNLTSGTALTNPVVYLDTNKFSIRFYRAVSP